MDHLLEISTQQLVTIARTTAYNCDEQHDYMKGAGGTDWFPHKWVVEAMRAAVTIRNTQAEDKVREELHQARAERDALQQLLNARDEEIGVMRRQLDALLNHCGDGECVTCGQIICPVGDGMHFHHDGCPSCAHTESMESQA